MKSRKIEPCLLTVMLLATALYFGLQDIVIPFSFYAVSADSMEEIEPWKDADGELYVFLPSYASLSELKIQCNSLVQFNDLTLANGENCSSLHLDQRYSLSNGMHLTFMQSQNIPAMYIDTESGSMNKINHGKKGTKEPGSLRIYSGEGVLEHVETLTHIETRGNYTFEQEKKPYNLRLSREADILGMGAAERWVLHANYLDSSNICNKMVYDFGEQTGMKYSPKGQWVDLYLNGEYYGLYLLCEKNEVHAQRVSLPQNDGVLVSKDQYGVLLEKKSSFFVTEENVPLRVRYSSLGENEMKQVFQSAENAVLAEDGVDPVSGKHWTELIDLDSWARKYIIEEIFCGDDAGDSSQFFYYNASDKKIYAGPVWDYDVILQEYLWTGVDTIDVLPEIMYAHHAKQTPWFSALYHNDLFKSNVEKLWASEFSPAVGLLLEQKIPQYQALISSASAMNQIRWDRNDFDEGIEQINAGLTERRKFLDEAWNGKNEYIEVSVIFNAPANEKYGSYTAYDYCLKPGERLSGEKFGDGYEWIETKTGERFDVTQPIFEETEIQLKPVEQVEPFFLMTIFLFWVELAALLLVDFFRHKKAVLQDPVLRQKPHNSC